MPFKKSLLLIGALTLAGCSYFQFPGIHKVEVQQGNIVTEDMVVQLQTGMTKAQVRYVMGTPLIADSFNQNRWDYFYSKQRGNKVFERENVTLFFDNDKLSRIVNDDQPAAAETPDKKKSESEDKAED